MESNGRKRGIDGWMDGWMKRGRGASLTEGTQGHKELLGK